MGMTYRDLFYKATRLIDKGEITLGEYEEMTKPLDREVKQEPKTGGDCISRQAVLDLMEYYNLYSANLMKCLVSDMPSVNAEPKIEWIPVSERLPEDGKTVIASIKGCVYPEARYTKEYGWEWAYESGADYWEELEDVIAWMPLPKPYKVESE